MSFWTTKLLWSATSLKLKRPDWTISDPFRLRTPMTCPIFVQVPTAYRRLGISLTVYGSGVCCAATPTFSTITLTRRTGNSLNDRVR